MVKPVLEPEKILLIDVCGETAGVAVSEGAILLAKEDLPRAVSTEIIAAVDRVLSVAGCRLKDLDAVGVVNGPGSFTGVRVGLAAAKGLCEASGARMIAISRLQVMADAVSLTSELLVIDAGREEFYLCDRSNDGKAREWLGSLEEVLLKAKDRRMIVTEVKTAERFDGLHPLLYSLHVEDAVKPVLHLYRSQLEGMTLLDANYLRREDDIYKKQTIKPSADIEA